MTSNADLFRFIGTHLEQAKCARASTAELLAYVAKNKDAEAFSVLTQRHGPEVYRWCIFFLRSKSDADDLFQEVFLTLWQKCSKVRDPNKLDGWLFRIVRNKAFNRLRSRKMYAPLKGHESVLACKAEDQKEALNKEKLEIVMRELGQLRSEYQEAILLTKVQGLTLQAAAEKMGCPVGTVSTYINRGLEQLVQRLKRYHIEFSVSALCVAYSEASAEVPASLIRATVAYMTSSTVATLLCASLISRMLLSGLLLLGLGVGVVTLYSKFNSAEPTSPLPLSPIAVARTVREINRQFIVESAVPRIVEEFKKLVGKDGSVRFLKLTELPGPCFCLEFELNGMLAVKIGGKPVRSKLRWYYYQPNGGVRAESDYLNEGKWTRVNIDKPVRFHEPWTGKEIFSYSFTPYKTATNILREMQIEHPPFIHPAVADEIAMDPKWNTIRRIVGIWYTGEPLNRAVIYLDQDKKIAWLGTDGDLDNGVVLILEEGEYQLYGHPQKFTLSEDGCTLKGRLWGEWKKVENIE